MADFQAVRWSREIEELLKPLLDRNSEELEKIGTLIQGVARVREEGQEVTDKQLAVILQHLHAQSLRSIEPHPGGVMVAFTGGGYELERFLLRPDGAMPNAQYEAVREGSTAQETRS